MVLKDDVFPTQAKAERWVKRMEERGWYCKYLRSMMDLWLACVAK